MDKKKKRNTKPKYEKQSKHEKQPKKEIEEIFDEIFTEDFYGKDFEFLQNQPVCESDGFVFKSEKNWSVDINKFSEFFSLDLNKLQLAIETVPFNEVIPIEEKYFTSDQLTNIHNKASKAQEKFAKLSQEEAARKNAKEIQTIIKNDKETIEDISDDLDVLLSLEEPAVVPATLLKQASNYGSGLTRKPKKENIDLEKWLDSVLDD